MQRSQVNRAITAQRANARALASPGIRPATIGTNPAMRGTVVLPGGNIGRQWGAHNNGGSGHDGYRSEWSMSFDAPYGGWS
jgi:hypothetical protein